MSDGPTLLKAILAEPDNDTARLVYADWLQENATVRLACDPDRAHSHHGLAGQFIHGIFHDCNPHRRHHHCDAKCWVSNGTKERAEFIRIQIELAPWEKRHSDFEPPHLPDLRRREKELLSWHRYAWIDGLLGPEWKTCGRDDSCEVSFHRGPDLTHPIRLEFVRGFVDHISCTWPDWCRHAAAIAAAQPIRGVNLLTDPVVHLGPIQWGEDYEPVRDGMRLSARWSADPPYGKRDWLGLSRLIPLPEWRERPADRRQLFREIAEREHTAEAYLRLRWPRIRFQVPDPNDVTLQRHQWGRL